VSKDFRTQDSHRYKKLGKRWRRPVGWQSKLRLKKNAAGRKVSIGYGTRKEGELDEVITVRNVHDVAAAKGRPIRIASAAGARNVLEIVKKAKEMDSRIVNAKKVKRARRVHRRIAERKKNRREKEKKKAEEAAKAKDGKGHAHKPEEKKEEHKEHAKAEEKKEHKAHEHKTEHKTEEKIKEEAKEIGKDIKEAGSQLAASQDEEVI
jgi:ribosomal protein L32E